MEYGYHMQMSKLVKIKISDAPIDPKIIYLGDILDEEEQVKATALLKKYANIFYFRY